jgi:hypothetical protein
LVIENNDNMPIFVRLPIEKAFLPLATSFVEKGALAFGLGEKETLGLTLAAEEIFSYLCHVAPKGQTIEIRCKSGVYFVLLDFLLSWPGLSMRPFNLTDTISLENEESLQEMGLLIASRFVDRLFVREESGKGIQLSLCKEKSYPEVKPYPQRCAGSLVSGFSIRAPLAEELKMFAPMVAYCYSSVLVHDAFRFPGKVVDMVGSGEYQAAVAVGGSGEIRGGILWHWPGVKTVECFGPYLLGRRPDPPMAEALIEVCLGAIAKTPALGLLVRLPTEDLPKELFETLGSLTLRNKDNESRTLTAYFRQIHEDLGATSWCHPELEPFLREEYDRLVLPREIRPIRDLGEHQNPFSVLSAEMDRSHAAVILRPLRAGMDAEKNTMDHLMLFRRESIANIFFIIDLGCSWHALFVPGLLKQGFRPRLILPNAGEGDTVVFQEGDSL